MTAMKTPVPDDLRAVRVAGRAIPDGMLGTLHEVDAAVALAAPATLAAWVISPISASVMLKVLTPPAVPTKT